MTNARRHAEALAAAIKRNPQGNEAVQSISEKIADAKAKFIETRTKFESEITALTSSLVAQGFGGYEDTDSAAALHIDACKAEANKLIDEFNNISGEEESDLLLQRLQKLESNLNLELGAILTSVAAIKEWVNAALSPASSPAKKERKSPKAAAAGGGRRPPNQPPGGGGPPNEPPNGGGGEPPEPPDEPPSVEFFDHDPKDEFGHLVEGELSAENKRKWLTARQRDLATFIAYESQLPKKVKLKEVFPELYNEFVSSRDRLERLLQNMPALLADQGVASSFVLTRATETTNLAYKLHGIIAQFEREIAAGHSSDSKKQSKVDVAASKESEPPEAGALSKTIAGYRTHLEDLMQSALSGGIDIAAESLTIANKVTALEILQTTLQRIEQNPNAVRAAVLQTKQRIIELQREIEQLFVPLQSKVTNAVEASVGAGVKTVEQPLSKAPSRTIDHVTGKLEKRDIERAMDKATQLLASAKAGGMNPVRPDGSVDLVKAEQQRTLLKEAQALLGAARRQTVTDHEKALTAFEAVQAQRSTARKLLEWEAKAKTERVALAQAAERRNEVESLFGEVSLLLGASKERVRTQERVDWNRDRMSGTTPTRELPKDLNRVGKEPALSYDERVRSAVANQLVTKRLEKEDGIRATEYEKSENALLKRAVALRDLTTKAAREWFKRQSTLSKGIMVTGAAGAAFTVLPLAAITAGVIVGGGTRFAVERMFGGSLRKTEAALQNARADLVDTVGRERISSLYQNQRTLRNDQRRKRARLNAAKFAAGLVAGIGTGVGTRAYGAEWMREPGYDLLARAFSSTEGATLPGGMPTPAPGVESTTSLTGDPGVVRSTAPESVNPGEVARRVVPGEPRPLPTAPGATPEATSAVDFTLPQGEELRISPERVAEAARGSSAPVVAPEAPRVTPAAPEQFVRVERGNTLSRLLHERLIEAEGGQSVPPAERQRLARMMYERFPEMRGADGIRATTPVERWALTPDQWREVGVRSGNPNELTLPNRTYQGDRIDMGRLLEIVSGRPASAPVMPTSVPVLNMPLQTPLELSVDRIREEAMSMPAQRPLELSIEGLRQSAQADNPLITEPVAQLIPNDNGTFDAIGGPAYQIPPNEPTEVVGSPSYRRNLVNELAPIPRGPLTPTDVGTFDPVEGTPYLEPAPRNDGRINLEDIDRPDASPVTINTAAAEAVRAGRVFDVERASLDDRRFVQFVNQTYGSVEKFIDRRDELLAQINPRRGFFENLFSVAVNDNVPVNEAVPTVTLEDFMAAEQSPVEIAAALREGDYAVNVDPESITRWRRVIPQLVARLQEKGVEIGPEVTIDELINTATAENISLRQRRTG